MIRLKRKRANSQKLSRDEAVGKRNRKWLGCSDCSRDVWAAEDTVSVLCWVCFQKLCYKAQKQSIDPPKVEVNKNQPETKGFLVAKPKNMKKSEAMRAAWARRKAAKEAFI